MELEKELEYYEKIKDKLLRESKEKVALIKGEELVGVYSNEMEAYEAGVDKFGAEPFLIRLIVEEQRPETIPAVFVEGLLADL